MFNTYLLLFIYITSTSVTEAIKCYKCTVSHPSYAGNETKRICSEFEHTNKFVVDCPFSTMCMKEIFYLNLKGKVIETMTRDCASQKKTEQVFKSGAWHKENTIEEAYTEGCVSIDANNVVCHCRGAYCNSAPNENTNFHSDIMAVIFIFNLLKFLRNSE